MLASTPDLLRLVAVPVLAWAAYRDLRTRRVPNAAWYPLAALGIALLAWETASGHPPAFADRLTLLRTALSVGLVVPLAYWFWRLGGFGGADAKAFMTIALLFPTFPVYFLPTVALPVVESTLGVFSLTVLTNTVLVGVAYPLALAARNAATGHVGTAMFLARRVSVDRIERTHGRLFESRSGFDRSGLDLDALRMYLRWRGVTLADLRADPDRYRDPDSIDTTYAPTDGAVATDGRSTDPSDGSDAAGEPTPGEPVGGDGREGPTADGTGVGADGTGGADTTPATDATADPDVTGDVDPDPGPGPEDWADDADPWGAAAFLESIPTDAYGTRPATLREGLETLVRRESVWVSPGIPFIVPTFVGLLAALTYGDLLVGALVLLGVGG
jgi:preflagellin peptidase FlaK